MRIGTALPAAATGVSGLALAGVVAWTAACASGGGRPAMTGAEAEALLGDYAGLWVLDESTSSPPTAEDHSHGRAHPEC